MRPPSSVVLKWAEGEVDEKEINDDGDGIHHRVSPSNLGVAPPPYPYEMSV